MERNANSLLEISGMKQKESNDRNNDSATIYFLPMFVY